MRSINISIKNSTTRGKCGIKTGNITISVHNLINPDDDFNRFLSEFVAVEFHEVGHRYDGVDYCSQWYADMTDKLIDYFYEHSFFT